MFGEPIQCNNMDGESLERSARRGYEWNVCLRGSSKLAFQSTFTSRWANSNELPLNWTRCISKTGNEYQNSNTCYCWVNRIAHVWTAFNTGLACCAQRHWVYRLVCVTQPWVFMSYFIHSVPHCSCMLCKTVSQTGKMKQRLQNCG